MKWLKEGDLNSGYFHGVMGVRNASNHIGKLKALDDKWLIDRDDIAQDSGGIKNL